MKKFIVAVLISIASAFIVKYYSANSSFAYAPFPEKSKTITNTYSPTQNTTVSDNISSNSKNNFDKKDKYENYKIPSVITSKGEWHTALNYCTYNLYDSITLEISNFDENTYNIKNLSLINASIKATGSVKSNKTAVITYTFSYKENYILNRAAQDEIYTTKLTPKNLALFNKIKKITYEIIDNNMNDFEKEKAIHDYIVLNSSYSKNITENSYNISNLITNRTGVCEAYAYTFKMMCSFAGLECEIITGTLDGENHGWNLIKLDGNYYHIDVTSDDPVPDKENQVLYFYFNLNDDEIAKTHKWDRNNFPKCTETKYNYYVYNNSVVETPEQMEKFILDNLNDGKAEIHFYVKNFIVKDTGDFKFCEKSKKSLKKFYLTGNIGSNGAFMFRPTYTD